jgi:hypothetical protein
MSPPSCLVLPGDRPQAAGSEGGSLLSLSLSLSLSHTHTETPSYRVAFSLILVGCTAVSRGQQSTRVEAQRPGGFSHPVEASVFTDDPRIPPKTERHTELGSSEGSEAQPFNCLVHTNSSHTPFPSVGLRDHPVLQASPDLHACSHELCLDRLTAAHVYRSQLGNLLKDF